MGNLDYIEQLGMGVPETDGNTEPRSEQSTESNEAQPQDMLTDFEDTTSEALNDGGKSNEEKTVSPEFLELKKQIEGMEKRIADKDAYIEELREASKLREASRQNDETPSNETDGSGVEDEFWEDPVAYVNRMKEEFARQTHIQQMQINETIYANTVEDYWNTVNQDSLLKAIKTDNEFAEKFNTSKEPYRLAYEYLTQQKSASQKSEAELREKIRQEVLAELGKSPSTKRETVPSTTNMGGRSGDVKSNAASDGFMAVFGNR